MIQLSFFSKLFFKKILFYKYMKRASQRFPHLKFQAWRKSPSAILKPDISATALTSIKSKLLTFESHAITFAIATTLTENILQRTDEGIDKVEKNNFVKRILRNIGCLEKIVADAFDPSVEKNSTDLNCPQDEPSQSICDFICSAEKPLDKKIVKRQLASISASSTPFKEIRQKLSISNKDLTYITKKSIRAGLVPLNSTQAEDDVRFSLLQTFYRDKFARQDSLNQEENMLKPQIARIFRKSNPRDKEQFAFDYNGEKIPINSSNSVRNNPLKILKTVYKVHKDRSDLKHMKKTLENIRTSKLPEVASSNRFMETTLGLYQLKKNIEDSVNLTGKLHSIKVITQMDEPK